MTSDTIAAIATPPGVGGVGIVRVSGPDVTRIARAVAGRVPQPGTFFYSRFREADATAIDDGLVLYFPAPNSFTGEDVVEFQGHGGPVVMDLLLRRVLSLGARMARPGEFSERAFLNGKIDLAQAEAIADLIESVSEDAARSATRSLQGEFSRHIEALVEQLTQLRMYCEAAIDFPEEEIDFLGDSKISEDLLLIRDAIEQVRESARSGVLLREGMRLVIAGRPNAGKSSLLNALARSDAAIVTEIPGTTRDVLREQIQIDGMPIHLVDTAGLRESPDPVEREGILRARREIASADLVLWVYDGREPNAVSDVINAGLPDGVPVTLVCNKIDLTGDAARRTSQDGYDTVRLSARDGSGVDELRNHLKERMGYEGPREGGFIARRRHLDAIDRAARSVLDAKRALDERRAGELLAEDLRQAQLALSEITGAVTADDLLGRIFSSFCIGK
jgi:tRNA modification GTPase